MVYFEIRSLYLEYYLICVLLRNSTAHATITKNTDFCNVLGLYYIFYAAEFSCVCSYLIFQTTGREVDYSHFTDKENGAQEIKWFS